MEITSLKKGKKNTYIATINGNEELLLYDDLIIKYTLLPKKHLTELELKKIKKEAEELEFYYKAIHYLSLRMRTVKEVKTYLKKSGYNENFIDKTIAKIKEEGYLKEEDYIKAFLSDAFRFQADGPAKIKQRLLNLGLEENKIILGLEEISKEQWMEKLEKLFSKKANSKHNDSLLKWQQKCFLYFYHLGYPKTWIEEISASFSWAKDTNNIIKEYEKQQVKWKRKYHGDELIQKVKQKLYERGYHREEIEEVIRKKEEK